MRNFKQYLTENLLMNIEPKDIKIENGIMIPNQFSNKIGYFECRDLLQLTSLENCPQEINVFNCSRTNITSLQFGPKIVRERFFCYDTKITSLDYAPLKCGSFHCPNNNILHLKGIGRSYLKDCKVLEIPNTIKSNILGLCLIKQLIQVIIKNKYYDNITSGDLFEAKKIIRRNKDVDECAEELRQNGFNDYAKF